MPKVPNFLSKASLIILAGFSLLVVCFSLALTHISIIDSCSGGLDDNVAPGTFTLIAPISAARGRCIIRLTPLMPPAAPPGLFGGGRSSVFSDGLPQQISSSLYLLLGPGNGDDSFVGSSDRLTNDDVGSRVGSDLVNARATMAYNCTGHILGYGDLDGQNLPILPVKQGNGSWSS